MSRLHDRDDIRAELAFQQGSATISCVKRVFVSYSHDDEDLAQQLKQSLATHGFDAWLAGDELHPGQRVADHIRDSLKSASAVVILVGRQPSDWVRYEWSQALELSWAKDRNIPLIPVVLHDGDPPSFLRDRQLVRIADGSGEWDDVARALEREQTPSRRMSSDKGIRERLAELEKTAAALSDETSLSA